MNPQKFVLYIYAHIFAVRGDSGVTCTEAIQGHANQNWTSLRAVKSHYRLDSHCKAGVWVQLCSRVSALSFNMEGDICPPIITHIILSLRLDKCDNVQNEGISDVKTLKRHAEE